MNPAHLAPWAPGANDPFDARKAAHLLRRAGFGRLRIRSARPWPTAWRRPSRGSSTRPRVEEDAEYARTFEAIAGSLVDFDDVDQLRAWWAYRMVPDPRAAPREADAVLARPLRHQHREGRRRSP